MVEIEKYLELRARPERTPAMHHKWRDLLFLHFSLEPHQVQPLLPKGLTVDTFPDRTGEEKAWIGLVAFWMTDIRFHGLPLIPGTAEFPETNVRTYAHKDGSEPGVWFFSLDAANRLAAFAARKVLGLAYRFAQMDVTREVEKVIYISRRKADSSKCNIQCRVGDPLDCSVPGTLEFFLIERYLLYAWRYGRLWTGRVHHEPYRLDSVEVDSCDETLIAAAGIPQAPWEHQVFSPGVDVEVFPFTEPK